MENRRGESGEVAEHNTFTGFFSTNKEGGFDRLMGSTGTQRVRSPVSHRAGRLLKSERELRVRLI